STPTLCRTSSILFFSLPCSSLFSLFFFSSSPAHPALHSFPTRRSSDLLLSDPDCQLVGARGIAMQAQGFKRDRHLSTVIKENFSDRKSTRLNSSHGSISYAVFCLKKKKK